MKNYSRQREAILNVLRSTDTHPTASRIYEMVQQSLPNISLGTVYRNLSALSKSGEILSLDVGDGFEHFDGDISSHAHLHCRSCGCITDMPLKGELIFSAVQEYGFSPDTLSCVVYGICKDCNQN
ncbi:MAG: transcriptional repressor [Clostridia bacterium]|nr:transcriptional repressor [Clostridia bacterium]